MAVGHRTRAASACATVSEQKGFEQMMPVYAKKWITLVNMDTDSPEYDLLFNELMPVMDWPSENPDLCWEFIQEVLNQTDDEKILYDLAAGPIESVLAHNPHKSIVILEDLSKKLPKLRNILDGVWQNLMPDDVWKRVQNLAKK